MGSMSAGPDITDRLEGRAEDGSRLTFTRDAHGRVSLAVGQCPDRSVSVRLPGAEWERIRTWGGGVSAEAPEDPWLERNETVIGDLAEQLAKLEVENDRLRSNAAAAVPAGPAVRAQLVENLSALPGMCSSSLDRDDTARLTAADAAWWDARGRVLAWLNRHGWGQDATPQAWETVDVDGLRLADVAALAQQPDVERLRLENARLRQQVGRLVAERDPDDDTVRQDAPEPGYQRIADAIRDALDGADLQIVVWRAGGHTPVTDGVARLARTLGKAGLIGWQAFTDQQGRR